MDVAPSIQALDAVGTSQAVAANNVANVNTDGFKASSVRLEDGPDGWGVRVGDIARDNTPGPMTYGANGAMVERSNTSIDREMVGMIKNGHAFSANVAAVRSWEQMTGTVIDMVA